MNTPERDRHVVTGRVQGVGFRPFVYRLALNHALSGFVLNAPEGVIIELQGQRPQLEAFAHALIHSLPPLAMLVSHTRQAVPPVPDEANFSIRESLAGEGHNVLVSPDVATCPDCLADMADPANRRFEYPFTNCTNCGPRYTITRSLPYDRDKTSMACFPLCPDCAREYHDPLDRRFHAQPNACPVCGPQVWLTDAKGRRIAEAGPAIEHAAKALAQGRVLALKGLGGFHLAVDATNPKAVALLRKRKKRPAKPLAVMVPDLQTLAALAEISPAEAAMLTGQERPIVLVRLLPDGPLAPDVSPDTAWLGAMLPYTPLHHVLLKHLRATITNGRPPALVMTSGNGSSEPIALGNREALARLPEIADLFLLHNRDILVRTDDSVVRLLPNSTAGECAVAARATGAAHGARGTCGASPAAGSEAVSATDDTPASEETPEKERLQFLRRSRGFTPVPVFLPGKGPCVLGVGPELKNTVCLTKDDQAFLSQHIGDMHNLETAAFHREVIDHLGLVLRVKPEAVVADLHPDYLSTRSALEQTDIPVLRVQHHHAHIMAVLAERQADVLVSGPVLGLALDGSGYGEDGTIWGGELLLVDPVACSMRRAGHFSPVRLPGGEAAIRQPWRVAQAFFHALGRPEPEASWPWLHGQTSPGLRPKSQNHEAISRHGRPVLKTPLRTAGTAQPRQEGREQAAAMVRLMLDKGLNSPVTTSCGRLFDAVSALLGLCLEITYEGQAAILLEDAQDFAETGWYPCPVLQGKGPAVLDTLSLFAATAEDAARGISPATVSRRFHLGLARGLADLAAAMAAVHGANTVALSGGVFLNRTISRILPPLLRQAGLKPLMHRLVPPGDGAVSLGQAYYGQRALLTGHF